MGTAPEGMIKPPEASQVHVSVFMGFSIFSLLWDVILQFGLYSFQKIEITREVLAGGALTPQTPPPGGLPP